MKKRFRTVYFLPIYTAVLLCLLFTTVIISQVVTTIAEASPVKERTCVIIDAGHGGVDGGATSCSGILESKINLEIALKLEDLMHLLGIDTKMIRRTDCSIYTQGNSIAAKKVSDLKQRVKIVKETANPILISIHQNHFSDGRYSGAQVFYAENSDSKQLAQQLQSNLVTHLNQNSKRVAKKAEGVYIMQHISCTGILVECGFLSNPEEDALLQDEDYQKNLCAIIATTVSNFLDLQLLG